MTAGLTAFYTGRAFFLTFFGPEKLPSPDDPEAEAEPTTATRHAPDEEPVHGHDQAHGAEHPIGHESPPLMVYPLVVLAVCAALAGLVFGPTHLFEHHLERTLGFESLAQVTHEAGWLTPLLGTIAAALGLGLSYIMYARPSPLPGELAGRIAPLYRASYHEVRGRHPLRLDRRAADPRPGGDGRVPRPVPGRRPGPGHLLGPRGSSVATCWARSRTA